MLDEQHENRLDEIISKRHDMGGISIAIELQNLIADIMLKDLNHMKSLMDSSYTAPHYKISAMNNSVIGAINRAESIKKPSITQLNMRYKDIDKA